MQRKKRVLLTHKIPEIGIDLLKKHFEVVILDSEGSLDIQLNKILPTVDYLISLLSVRIDNNLLRKFPNLKGIANYAVGYNNIDINAAIECGIPVTNTPDVLTNATADLTWGLILAVTRRIVEGDKECRQATFSGWAPEYMLGYELSGKTLGIVGMGRIGTAVAKRGTGFDMKICYHSRTKSKDLPESMKAVHLPDLKTFLESCDIVSLHVPYTDKTHHFIGENELNWMKKNAFLINTSRGKVIDEVALINTLSESKIAGAGLDVYYNEPLIPKGLRELNNTVLTPHIGSATKQAREAMAIMVAENIIAIEKGLIPPNLIPEMKKEILKGNH
ncbi:D-glycerate dehydrogenase [Candidatus Heimdallarchaeota archaeon B3_Heim]|nr:MAG: D-glycerate dehydrogenase [Candidatus Heimdallarchaeota archaeon B3_Heim]